VSEAAASLARAILPPGRVFPGGGAHTIEAAGRRLAEMSGGGGSGARVLGILCRALDRAAILRTGRRFHALPAERQDALLRQWQDDPLLRWPLFALSFLVKQVHFDDPDVYRAMGCVYDKGGPAEPAPWVSQVARADELAGDEDLECDVVVVGTGAGGGVVGTELARRGHAVVFLEEGELHRRDAFRGHAAESHQRFYRKSGLVALGNTLVPIFVGKLVGGSTAINTGTCFRTPPWILDRWCEAMGSDALSPAALAPYFDRVEQELQVEPARAEYLGGVARVVARGCDALGWNHYPIRRNAPACDGQGVCDYGCPSGARRSTDISYIPQALRRGAMLYTGVRAERVFVEGGRAVGVEARGVRGGARLRVRARAVILACGAVPTPTFLLGQGLANASGQVGRNLSLHPCTVVSALFDERIAGYNAIPQGYTCDHHLANGILLSGASAPLDIGASYFPFNGRRLMDTMEAYDRVASFMVIIRDDSRGRVRRRRDGRPLITYWLQRSDVDRLHRGMVSVIEIFRAAGARRFFPIVPRMSYLDSPADVERFRSARLRASDPFLTSFHPMGTCRMGADPKASVVDTDHECHDVPGLFLVDGSVLPGPPSVNPQLTIMALAARAADRIAAKL
jgi:choline dehydrogenase-like flavoprotein